MTEVANQKPENGVCLYSQEIFHHTKTTILTSS